MRYAIVKDGKVINTIQWDGESKYTPPEGSELVSLEGKEGGIDWDYINGEFVDNRPQDDAEE